MGKRRTATQWALLTLFTTMVFPLVSAAAQVTIEDIRSLPGYKNYTTLGSFTDLLIEHPTLFSALSRNKALSEQILGSTNLQRKMLRDLKITDSVQGVISQYASLASTTTRKPATYLWTAQRVRSDESGEVNGVTSSDEGKDQEKSQRLEAVGTESQAIQRSRENAQLMKMQAQKERKEAPRLALAKAQLENKTALKRAQARIKSAQEQLDGEDAEGLKAHVNAYSAATTRIEKALKGLEKADVELYQAFLTNGKLLQEIMDGERTLIESFIKLGFNPAAFDIEGIKTAVGIDMREPGGESKELGGDESGGDRKSLEPTDKLVHVSGNHYKINDKELYALNKVPEKRLQSGDSSNWPEYLNVPDGCPAPDRRLKYIHEFRLDFGSNTISDSGKSGDMKRVESWFDRGVTFAAGLTSREVMAVPFVTTNAETSEDFKNRFLGDIYHGDSFPFSHVALSISDCPGTFSQDYYPENNKFCNLTGLYGATSFEIRPKGESAQERLSCVLRPNKLYFLNVAHLYHLDLADLLKNDKDLVQGLEKQPWMMDMIEAHNPDGPIKDYIAGRLINQDHGQFSANFGRKLKRDGMYVGGFELKYQGERRRQPPYAGPCLNSPPYPLNYDAAECGRVRSAEDTRTPASSLTWDCIDPDGMLPRKTFVRELVGSQLIWTKGFNDPGYSSYVCSYN